MGRARPRSSLAMSSYLKATAVTRTDEASYAVELDPGWAIGGNPHGGDLMAVLAKGAVDAAASPHALAVSAHFLRPPHGGEAQVRVEVVKRGRTASTVRATLWQAGKGRPAPPTPSPPRDGSQQTRRRTRPCRCRTCCRRRSAAPDRRRERRLSSRTMSTCASTRARRCPTGTAPP